MRDSFSRADFKFFDMSYSLWIFSERPASFCSFIDFFFMAFKIDLVRFIYTFWSSLLFASSILNSKTTLSSWVNILNSCWTICIQIRRRHLDTVPQMAMAVVKLNQKGDISEGVSDTIQYFLDRLYINRSGQRIACRPLHERAISGSQSTCWSLTSMLCKGKALLSRAWSVLLVILFSSHLEFYIHCLFHRWAQLTRSVMYLPWPTMHMMQLR